MFPERGVALKIKSFLLVLIFVLTPAMWAQDKLTTRGQLPEFSCTYCGDANHSATVGEPAAFTLLSTIFLLGRLRASRLAPSRYIGHGYMLRQVQGESINLASSDVAHGESGLV